MVARLKRFRFFPSHFPPPCFIPLRGMSHCRLFPDFWLFSILLATLLTGATDNLFAGEPTRNPAPDLSLEDNQGEVVRLEDYLDQVVMVSFWATWCPPCIEEFPSQQKLKEANKNQNFEVLAVNLGQSKSDIDHFLFSLESPVNFPILLDTDSVAAKEWKIRALPTTILIDKNGNEVFRVNGPRDWNDRESREKISALLRENNKKG
ncbi:MAG: redoxin domain-containing protein [Gammaproteobacteria bacterium]|nr:redoxin domain-containing protein [Gammaproteobacteria bacterium]